ncbi:MAG: PSD1 and planctomycete cytochrome C domain-containing protein [Phycisphaeraceae bacterium]
MLTLTLLLPAAFAQAADIDFARDIQPLFTKHCVSCHGPDKQKGGLRLDTKKSAMHGGDSGPVILAKKAGDSELLKRVRGDEPDDIMPPKGDPLSKEQVALIARWIESGAVWPDAVAGGTGRRTSDHWSFQPIRKPALPQVKDTSWPRNAIDHFILAKLEASGLKPSKEANPYTLIRRLYLDLTGLLPTPEEAEAFAKDKSPDAYDKLVDRILASPHYGERWGRHWLDQARYADSNGYSVDSARTMWPYRDWVIDALNKDMPFDQFTILQLAGDLVEEGDRGQETGVRGQGTGDRKQETNRSESPPTPVGGTRWVSQSPTDRLIATAFHRNTLINQEGGVKGDQFRVEATYDRVATTGQVWLGLTIACAQCHTHKFDPITQKEYYEFYAFFNQCADENNTGPTVSLPLSPQVKERIAFIEGQVAALEKRLGEHDAQSAARQAAWEKALTRATVSKAAVKWQALDIKSLVSEGGATLKQLDDKSILVTGKRPANDEFTVVAEIDLPAVTAARLEVLTHDSLPQNGPGTASNGNFVLTGFLIQTGEQPAFWRDAFATHAQPSFPIEHAIDRDSKTGWAINIGKDTPPGVKMNDNHEAYFFTNEPLKIERDSPLTFTLKFELNANYHIGRFRLSVTHDKDVELTVKAKDGLTPDLRSALNTLEAKRSAAQKKLLADAFAAQDAEREPLTKEITALQKELAGVRKSTTSVMVYRDLPKPRTSFVHIRGDFLRLGPEVTPAVPEVLPEIGRNGGTEGRRDEGKADPQSTIRNPQSLPNRLDLARWLVDERNPLTARVTMNRAWMRYFPKGLVETEEDFGTQGTPPTHPQLLDWLAWTFVHGEGQGERAKGQGKDINPSSAIRNSQSPWSLKAMHRLIVTSATYRQSSVARADLMAVDPFNKLLGRQSRLRVDAEIVRDIALAAGGLLSSKVGGPSVYPPQPQGVYDFTQNRQAWNESKGEDRYRRGMYTFFFRSAPYPMLTTFDVPNMNAACTSRVRSNTPLQALSVANDEAMIECAQALALRVLGAPPGRARADGQSDKAATDSERVVHLFRLCLTRPPQQAELQRLTAYLKLAREKFSADAAAAKAIAPANRPKDVTEPEAAAWTALARAVMNLDEFITRE